MEIQRWKIFLRQISLICFFAITLSPWLMGAPVVSGVLNGATFKQDVLAPGTIISIWGTGLASATAFAPGYPLPLTLSGTTVSVNSQSIPLFYASPTQINAQLPYTLTNGSAQLVVRAGGLTGSFTINIDLVSPGIFTTTSDGIGQALAVHADFTPVLRVVGQNAKTGETISIFCTGLGSVSGFSTSGSASPAAPPANTITQVSVSMNGNPAQVTFSGLAPGYAGLYQINFVIPPGMGGDVITTVQVGSTFSNAVTINVAGGYNFATSYSGALQNRATGSQSQLVFDSITAASATEFTGTYKSFAGTTILDNGSVDIQNSATGLMLFGTSLTGGSFIGTLNSLDAGQSFTGVLYAASSVDQITQKPDGWYVSFSVSSSAFTSHSVVLTWGASPSPAVTAYFVYRAASQNGPYNMIGVSSAPAFVDLAVPSGSTLWYQVTAINSAGESVPSNQASANIPSP